LIYVLPGNYGKYITFKDLGILKRGAKMKDCKKCWDYKTCKILNVVWEGIRKMKRHFDVAHGTGGLVEDMCILLGKYCAEYKQKSK